MWRFQSTPPSRVATPNPGHERRGAGISIHTTLAGGDAAKKGFGGTETLFQSTPPSRVATKDDRSDQATPVISIHTTLAGGDLPYGYGVRSKHNFNPHHPRGWRQQRRQICGIRRLFQSTPPSRVATLQRQPIVPPMPNFNPHHPRGWRPAAALYESDVVHISIHTTLAGGDLYGKWIYRSCLFISIHTTLAGGDLGFSTAIELDNQFQSTPPSRVATIRLTISMVNSIDFNPHHPRGWRP